MSLVSVDDRPLQPRVLPSVFSDLPSAAELQEARRSRNNLAILTVLLAGALVAAGVAVFFLYSQMGNPSQQVADLERVVREKNAQIASLESDTNQYRTLLGQFEVIREPLNQGQTLRNQIRDELARRPWAQGAAGNYEQSAWATESQRLAQMLRQEAERLMVTKARVENTPRPVTVNPNTRPDQGVPSARRPD